MVIISDTISISMFDPHRYDITLEPISQEVVKEMLKGCRGIYTADQTEASVIIGPAEQVDDYKFKAGDSVIIMDTKRNMAWLMTWV